MLVPIDLFEPVGGTVLAVLMWSVFTAFPFAFAFHIADESLGADKGEEIDWCIVGFCATLAVALLLSIRGMAKKRPASFPAPRDFQFVRFNWENVDSVAAEVVDFVQMACLLLSVGVPMKWSDELQDAAGCVHHFLPLNIAFYTSILLRILSQFQ